MAHDQTQGGDQDAWSQGSEGYGRRTSFPAPAVCRSGAEQGLRLTSPSSGLSGNGQSWMPVAPTYTQPYEVHYSSNGYQQPISPGPTVAASSAYGSHTDVTAGPQVSPMAQYAYASPPPFANHYHHMPAYPTAGYQMNSGYNPIGATGMPLSASSATPAYQGPAYSHVALATSVPAPPPAAVYTMPPVQSPEGSQIDAEYSVPCPYRCGTVLTGVHALGNLTRHLKTEACAGSSRAKVRYPCPIEGCERQYARSDGLKVHMRRRHGAPPPVPRTDGVVDDEED